MGTTLFQSIATDPGDDRKESQGWGVWRARAAASAPDVAKTAVPAMSKEASNKADSI
jgi:hypothetical protein